MDIENILNKFEQNYKTLSSSEENALAQFINAFEKYVAKIYPIIKIMKKHELYFTHPDLPNIYTIHGPIIGRNKYDSYIYIYDENGFVQQINYNNDNQSSDRMPFRIFAKGCDIKFAYRGIKHIIPRLYEIIKIEEGKINTLTSLTQNFSEELNNL